MSVPQQPKRGLVPEALDGAPDMSPGPSRARRDGFQAAAYVGCGCCAEALAARAPSDAMDLEEVGRRGPVEGVAPRDHDRVAGLR